MAITTTPTRANPVSNTQTANPLGHINRPSLSFLVLLPCQTPDRALLLLLTGLVCGGLPIVRLAL